MVRRADPTGRHGGPSRVGDIHFCSATPDGAALVRHSVRQLLGRRLNLCCIILDELSNLRTTIRCPKHVMQIASKADEQTCADGAAPTFISDCRSNASGEGRLHVERTKAAKVPLNNSQSQGAATESRCGGSLRRRLCLPDPACARGPEEGFIVDSRRWASAARSSVPDMPTANRRILSCFVR